MQFLTFMLSEEVYGVEVSKVREVLEVIDITKVPRMPPFMRGVINLRGGVVPVVDLAMKFGMDAIVNTVNTCIIVLEVEVNGDLVVVGALADSVREVIELDLSQIEPAPRIGTTLNTEFIEGIGKRDDEFIIILTIDRIFSVSEITAVKTGVQEEEEEEVSEEDEKISQTEEDG
ncbi:chemotaxis protein CheW [Sediminispirochaeta bajacaliforniensis]|uniref:chemotaxis protein CheW n=1 Tax=Sediminispirochaeta bajacaliforniensis TaxID=148 RepID=UPI00037C7A04|nr:chemotaxis protein CheW [Sediminispirochaeta bajacaliforniensis]